MAALPNFRLFRRKPRREPATMIARFLALPEHRWIAQDPPLLRRIGNFLAMLPAEDLATILEERRLLLLYCNQKMSCAFYQFDKREIVLIFPDLRRLLTSAQYLRAYAVLAHECAHVLHGHAQKVLHPVQAQIEADCYARELGLGQDLVAVLAEEEASEELVARLEALML